MKKYLLGMLAIVFATIGVFATNVNSKTDTAKVQTPMYYWYSYDGSVLGQPLSANQLTHTQAKNASGCPDASGIDCARAFSSTQTPGTNPSGVQDRIKKN